MDPTIIEGDLLEQTTDAIINPWNRNLIPWWLLLPKGVSGAIKRRGGVKPFTELRRFGVLPLGGAAITSAGRLPFKAIIHVAGIGHNWCSSEDSIRKSVRSALAEAQCRGLASVAFPLIGAGTGGSDEDSVLRMMVDECSGSDYSGKVIIVRYRPKAWPYGNCYCGLWEKNPETLEKRNIPPGYCGICQVCGKPGHLQHFPGSSPYTGEWCKKHYYRAMILHPMGAVGCFVWGGFILALIFACFRLLQ